MILVIVVSVIVLVVLISWFSLIWDAKTCDVPGPFPFPLIGNGHYLVGKPTEFLNILNKLRETYGNAVRIHLFSRRYVLFYHPKHIEGIVSHSEIITKGWSYSFLRDWLGDGLLTSTGSKWRSHRKFLTPAFHFNILHNFLPVFCKNARVLNDVLLNQADGKTDLNLFPVIALAALDNVTESIMGISLNTQQDRESEYVKAIAQLSSIISLRAKNPFIANELIFNLSIYKKIQGKALDIVHGYTKKVIEIRKEELKKANITTLGDNPDIGMKNKHAFLDLLLLSEIDGVKISDEMIREEVDTFMFEGHDTTTSAICFSLFCISRHNEVQDKVLAEQMNMFADDFNRDPTFSELNQMKYLEMVIKESLRLFPAVPLIERMIIKDVDVAGFRLKKNTSAGIDIFHMQRLPEVYEDPLQFRPERFESTNARNPFSWLAFSAGPRNCIGQKFAMMEMKVTLSRIIRNFELLPSNIEPMLLAHLILRSENGVHIKLKQRNLQSLDFIIT